VCQPPHHVRGSPLEERERPRSVGNPVSRSPGWLPRLRAAALRVIWVTVVVTASCNSLRYMLDLTPNGRRHVVEGGYVTLRSQLEALVSAVPPDTMVSARWLKELLAAEADAGGSVAIHANVDLTVTQLASRFGKGTSTIRTWLERGDFPGAYRLHAREWRVPPSSVEAMQSEQSKRHRASPSRTSSPSRPADLSAWRKHQRKAS
jgi:hypothetical protein